MAQKYYGDYEKEVLGRQGLFDPAQIESGSVKLDPNYGLWEAKKGYAQAEKSGNEADKSYYRDMGKHFRANGATLDPNNTMNAQQFSDAYWGQFGAGGSTNGSTASSSYTTQSAYKGPAQGNGYTGGDYFTNYMNDMNSYMDQYGAAGQELLRNYQTQYSQALAGLQNLLAQKPDVPESVKYAVDMLKKQTDDNVRLINEDMNRRGIYNSTIATDRTAQERTRMSDQERALLSNWLDQQHQQMYQTALKMADMQAGYASNYANLAAQTTLGALDKRMGLAGQKFDIQNQMAQQQRQEELARQQAEAQAQQAETDRYWQNYWNQMKYTTPTAGEQLSYDAAVRRLQQAGSSTGSTTDTWAKNHATAVEMASTNIKPAQFVTGYANGAPVYDWNAYYDAINRAVPQYEAQLNAGRPDTSTGRREHGSSNGTIWSALNQPADNMVNSSVSNIITTLRAVGASDAEIANALRNDGYDPSQWGLH